MVRVRLILLAMIVPPMINFGYKNTRGYVVKARAGWYNYACQSGTASPRVVTGFAMRARPQALPMPKWTPPFMLVAWAAF